LPSHALLLLLTSGAHQLQRLLSGPVQQHLLVVLQDGSSGRQVLLPLPLLLLLLVLLQEQP
jgi:hypothetical protein